MPSRHRPGPQGTGTECPQGHLPHQPQPQVQKLRLAPSCAPPAPSPAGRLPTSPPEPGPVPRGVHARPNRCCFKMARDLRGAASSISSSFVILQSEDMEQKFTTVHHCRHFTQEDRPGLPKWAGSSCGREGVHSKGVNPLRGDLARSSLFSRMRRAWALSCPSAASRGPGQPLS